MKLTNKNSRTIAYEILVKILINKKHSHILLNELNDFNLDIKDKNLARNIILLTLKNKYLLEININQFIDKNKTPIKIQVLLWMSLAQILFLDKIPNYAILNDGVLIAKKVNYKLGNFCNAVLRKFLNTKTDIKFENEIDELNFKYSWNKNIIKTLLKNYDKSTVIKILEDSLNQSKLDYRVNTIKINFDDFVNKFQKGYNFEVNPLVKNMIRANNSLIKTDLFEQGYLFAQDPLSAKVVEILDPRSSDIVLDMCAAPGSKTTYISALMDNKSEVTAVEIQSNKIIYIKQNLDRLGIENVKVLNLDALKIEEDKKFDKILLDAPCSGWGVIKRKPEIKLKFNSKSLKLNVDSQAKLLEKAYNLMSKNGVIVYSTCTINKLENESQINNFLKKYPDMEIISQKLFLGYEYDSDYFFVTKMKKRIKDEC